MKRLIIVGAGEFGREILGWLDDINNSEWHEICFIDDNPNNLIVAEKAGIKHIHQFVGAKKLEEAFYEMQIL